MGVLDELIGTLNEREMETVTSLPLKGAEQRVMTHVVDMKLNAATGKPLQEDMSIDHLYKVQSVLLRKCYEALVPDGGSKLIWYLNNKSLYKLMFREMQRQEELLDPEQTSPETLQEFYRECFLSTVDVLAAHFDETNARQYGEKYLKTLGSQAARERILIEVRIAYANMIRAAMKATEQAERLQIGQNWLLLLDEATTQQHREAEMRALKGLIYYHTYFQRDMEQRYSYLTRWEALCNDAPDDRIFIPLKRWCENDLAEYHFACNNFRESVRRYRKLYNNDNLTGPYASSRYAQVAILAGETEEAARVLETFFAPAVKNFDKSITPMAMILYAQYHLHTGDMDQARIYIEQLAVANTKTFYEVYEVTYRALQTIWHWRAGDMNTTATLAASHIKYLRKKKIPLDYDPLTMVFPLMQALCKQKQGGRNLSKRHRQMQTDLSSGPPYLLGKLMFE